MLVIFLDFVNFKISQNPSVYFNDISVDIPEDQAFYLTDQGIVIYFAYDQISPAAGGIPKFLMEFSDFESYINPRFYCTMRSMSFYRNRRSRFPQYNNRVYY